MLELFGVGPDYDLDLMTPDQDLFDITVRVIRGLKDLLEQERPHLVLVHGDTTTTFAAALAAFNCISRWAMWRQACAPGIRPTLSRRNQPPFGWVPGRLSLCPYPWARDNLLAEGVPAENIWVTGNTVIDALYK